MDGQMIDELMKPEYIEKGVTSTIFVIDFLTLAMVGWLMLIKLEYTK